MMQKRSVVFVFLLLGGALFTRADYAAQITLNSDRSWVTRNIEVVDGYLVSETGKATIPLRSVKQVEYRFAGITLGMCEAYFKSGNLKSLEDVLMTNIRPTLKNISLPSNLGEYLLWLLRSQFWQGDFAGTLKTVEMMKLQTDRSIHRVADLYHVLVLLEKKQLAEANSVWSQIDAPEKAGTPLVSYVRARFALLEGDYRLALQKISLLLGLYCKDAEWMPAAIALEARLYLEVGKTELALRVADELVKSYPGTRWSRYGEKLKRNPSSVLR